MRAAAVSERAVIVLDGRVDDQLWAPEVWEGAKGLLSWGPEPTPSFLNPRDVAAHMTGAHSAG